MSYNPTQYEEDGTGLNKVRKWEEPGDVNVASDAVAESALCATFPQNRVDRAAVDSSGNVQSTDINSQTKDDLGISRR